MSSAYRNLDPKARRQIAIANLSLAVGLLLILFVHPSGNIGRNWLHVLSGFLLGLSIAINLFVFRFASRCREKQV
jgi:hypothetical protein